MSADAAETIWREPRADVWLRHRNPAATMDLVLPVHLTTNIPKAQLIANARINARGRWPWLNKVGLPNTQPLTIVGSGPSMLDHLDEIRELSGRGPVWTLNGAATVLCDAGLTPDAQVIIDARPRTVSVFEGRADKHYFAAQVDPALPRKSHAPWIFHHDLETDMDWLPAGATIVGGSGSCGIVAMMLAHTRGFRDLHLFGYDSSYRGDASHARHQPINDGEPFTRVAFRGTEYTASLTMASQADLFIPHAEALIEAGATVTVHGDGLLPAKWQAHKHPTREAERDKYRRMWQQPAYAKLSPAMEALPRIRELLCANPGAHIIDFGCGDGRAAQALSDTYRVTGVDHVDALRPGVGIPLVECCLWELPDSVRGAAGICCDVMEHIPTQYVDEVLSRIAWAVNQCLFTISFERDNLGGLIGEQLHLTVRPEAWWLGKIAEFFPRVQNHGNGLIEATHG